MNTVPFEEYFDPMSILIEDATAPEAPEVIYDFIDSHSFRARLDDPHGPNKQQIFVCGGVWD